MEIRTTQIHRNIEVSKSVSKQRTNNAQRTRSSAVAVIADLTACDVTGFGYMNDWYARSDSMGRVYERTQTQFTQARLTKFAKSVNNNHTTSARLIVCLK